MKEMLFPNEKNLSKTTSELKNDPLYLESFFPSPSEELKPIPEELNHTPGFDGLTIMINETYKTLSNHDLNFKRYVAPSAYAYYVAVLAWARPLWLKLKNKYQITHDEHKFVKMIYGNFQLPKSISLYLSGIGNFNIPSGPESKFNMISYTYDQHGYFIDLDNNFALATGYPCISVYAERIMRDLGYTDNPNVGTEWSPNDLEREWNNRCLGYESSQILTHSQTSLLENAKITSASFPSDAAGLRVNIRLMKAVQEYLLAVRSLELNPVPVNLTGSQGQMVADVVDTTPTMLNEMEDLGSVHFVPPSPFLIPGPILYLSSSFLYRVIKDLPTARARFFFPYTLDPTAADIQNLNQLNRGWSPLLEGVYHYETTPFKASFRVKKICTLDI